MSKDLSQILDGWDYKPESSDTVLVRIVKGNDNKDKIQLRIDLGVLQMEMEGRPDGVRPENCDSWFDFYQKLQISHDDAHPDSAPFQLPEEAYHRLWREAAQYYHRYLSAWHLKLYDLCARDTKRNLRLFEFVRDHALEDRAKLQFDQWFPYVTMMHVRAIATPLLNNGKLDEAVKSIEAGIDSIHDFLDKYGQEDNAEECAELNSLEKWRIELTEKLSAKENYEDVDPNKLSELSVETLRKMLKRSIDREEFELASELRDEIRRKTSQQ